MKKSTKRLLPRLLKALLLLVLGGLITVVVVGIALVNSKQDLKIWHVAELDAEFSTESGIRTFEEYLALEDELFRQLDERVYDRISPADKVASNRYHRGSLADPANCERNWNRSFELAGDPADRSRPAVLLLHGLSDSPYSLRSIGQRLHDQGAHVLGLRIPGHGTAPSVLTETTWQDMAAAVEIAVRHLQGRAAGRPFYIVGYSNGGALAVHYALSAIERPELHMPDGLVLISPEIGITPMAAMAIWQERAGRLLGLDKLNWTGIAPEYDPYKYTSFPANAGNLAHALTRWNRKKISQLGSAAKLDSFPPTLAFQSILDATITASSLVRDLFDWLPANGHELVIFDLNRNIEIEALLKSDPGRGAFELLDSPDRSFTLTLLTNATASSEDLVARTWGIGQTAPTQSETGLRWPPGVFSLTHVALPFPDDDPVYGGKPQGMGPGIQIGIVAARGEKGALQIPAQDMLRLRWNPFHPYLSERLKAHLGIAARR